MLDYLPAIGAVLLTVVIVWIVASTIYANRRNISDAIHGRYYVGDKSPLTIHLSAEDRMSEKIAAARQYIRELQSVMPEIILRDSLFREEPEVTSQADLADDAREAARIAHYFGDEGEPLPASLSRTPNVGGEDHPDYQGPHYAAPVDYTLPENRFVPYDVLRDPPQGAAVHFVGNTACVGPLEADAQGDQGHAESAEDNNRSD
jgi:hypothetical protein